MDSHPTFSGFVEGDQGVEDLGEVESLKEVGHFKRLRGRKSIRGDKPHERTAAGVLGQQGKRRRRSERVDIVISLCMAALCCANTPKPQS